MSEAILHTINFGKSDPESGRAITKITVSPGDHEMRVYFDPDKLPDKLLHSICNSAPGAKIAGAGTNLEGDHPSYASVVPETDSGMSLNEVALKVLGALKAGNVGDGKRAKPLLTQGQYDNAIIGLRLEEEAKQARSGRGDGPK
jgi:hypothetical protein